MRASRRPDEVGAAGRFGHAHNAAVSMRLANPISIYSSPALETWLAHTLPHLEDVRIAAVTAPSHAGQSAQTVFIQVHGVRDGARQVLDLVLRRQLEGMDLFLNSDLHWQCDVLKAMARQAGVRVPEVVGIEMERSVLGSPFYVMTRITGRVVPQNPNYNQAGWLTELTAEQRCLVWTNNIKALARVHKVDWRDGFEFMSGLTDGAPGLEQYLHHIERWFTWAANGREQPVADAALEWLRRNQPDNAPVQVIWGDAIPANTLFADDLSVAALLDWEMAALGPGEIDLAWFLLFDDFFSRGMGVPRLAGLPDREQIIATYETEAGRHVGNIEYYEVLAMLRLAIITVRGCDRQIALGNISSHSKALTHNPITAMIAHRLGLPVPQVGADFAQLLSAAGRAPAASIDLT
jgi:aminoglycoside phosphotransferase (APT) family kinase protein